RELSRYSRQMAVLGGRQVALRSRRRASDDSERVYMTPILVAAVAASGYQSAEQRPPRAGHRTFPSAVFLYGPARRNPDPPNGKACGLRSLATPDEYCPSIPQNRNPAAILGEEKLAIRGDPRTRQPHAQARSGNRDRANCRHSSRISR